MREFSAQTKGLSEIWTSYPEWPVIDKMDKQIRELLDDVKVLNTACQNHANQFESIAKKENLGEINAPGLLLKAKKYIDEFDLKLSSLNKELTAASDVLYIKNLPKEEEKKQYLEQLKLIQQYIVELEGLRSVIKAHYVKLNLELKGKNMVWIGPGMAAWNAVDALKANTDRVNVISKKIAECSRIINSLRR